MSGRIFLPGGRHITSPLSRAMLAPLQSERFVQFPHPLTDREYRQVARLLQGHPKVTLRAYGLGFTDLEFLRSFPFPSAVSSRSALQHRVARRAPPSP